MKPNAKGAAKPKLGMKLLKAKKLEKGDVVANEIFAFEDIAAEGLSFLLKIRTQPLMHA